MMERKRVGYSWDEPKDIEANLLARIGGYCVMQNNHALYICGAQIFNVTESPILSTMIMPVNKEYLEGMYTDDKSIASIYEFEDIVYYVLTYGRKEGEGSGSYVFKNYEAALSMLNVFVDYKAQSLQYNIDN